MRIGICSTDFPPMSADMLFGTAKGMGFEAMQLALGSVLEAEFEEDGALEIPAAISGAAIRAIGNASARHGLPVTVLNGTFNMAHPDAEIRAEGVRRFGVLMAAAEALGVRMATLCTGTRNRASLWAPHADNATEAAYRDARACAAAMARQAAAHGVTLLIETEASNVARTPEAARRLMDDVGADCLRVVLDAANLFLPGRAKPALVADTLRHAFDVVGSAIALAHGKDIRESDGIEFCATGEGIVDFPLFLRLLRAQGYTGDMMLHGIYDLAKMPPALARMRAWARSAGLAAD